MSQSKETEQALISRREAIRVVGALLGGVALVGGSGLLAAAEGARPTPGATGAFSAQDIAFLDEIAETILPATKTPGAKAAKTGAFMAVMVTDCYNAAQQKVFREGMRKLEDACKKANDVSFMNATPTQRLEVLAVLDKEQKRHMDAREKYDRIKRGLARVPLLAATDEDAKQNIERPAHYFRMMKELTLLGFFTSEIGCKQALRYVEAPGRFDACLPYKEGDPAWAQHA